QVGNDAGVEHIGLGAAMTEADDVELDRRHQLELRRRPDAPFEMARERAGARDHGAERVGAIDLEGEPGLEGAKTAREVGAVVAWPWRAGGKAARLAPQVGGLRREGAAVEFAIADEDEPGVVGHLPPLVEVERERVGAFDAGKTRREIRRED